MEPTIILETRSVLLPYGTVLCGVVTPITLEVVFEYFSSDSEEVLKLISLTGAYPDGRIYDLSYMIEAEYVDYGRIIECVLGNKHWWDEKEVWW